ncbi:MAG: hypothetical protein GXP25_08775 [Planctomycetes bacterium]|nr:hypothetical protein [Planctomycetota bacterium]
MKTLRKLLLLFDAATFIPRRLLVNRLKPPVAIAKQPGELIVLCTGDSLTANTYPKRLQKRLAAAAVKARVLNYGVDGFTSGEYLWYARSTSLFRRTKPDIVLLQLGTNDVRCDFRHTPAAAFRRNMRRIIHLARDAGATVLVATIPPVCRSIIGFSRRSVWRAAVEINPAIHSLAAEYDLALVDNYLLFRRHPQWLPGVHPTQEGYHGMADNWLRALVECGLLHMSGH